MANRRILLVDDDLAIGAVFRRVAESSGFRVEITARASAFMNAYTASIPDVVVLDLGVPDVDGIELLRFLADLRCRVPILIISGFGGEVLASAASLGEARGLNIAGIIPKPFRSVQLRAMLDGLAGPMTPTPSVGQKYDLRLQDLELALDRGELSLAYQPKVSLTTNRMIGVEALARWHHPDYGSVAPSYFIPLAEVGGLIDRLTNWVISTAASRWKDWQSRGLVTNIAVNVSALNLSRLEFPDIVAKICDSYGMPSQYLTIELTESATQGVVELLDTLTRFRLKKMGVSLDDFGTGYSSLSQLHQLPFSELKIDRSFVMKSHQADSLAILKAGIDLAHDMGLQSVAEGVETEQAKTLLTRLGCDAAQGYLFAKPMTGDALVDWTPPGSDRSPDQAHYAD